MENKFGIYDLVAYIIPGSILLFSLILLVNLVSPIDSELLSKNKVISVFLFISSSYVLGQISGSFTKAVTRKTNWNKIDFTKGHKDLPYLFVNMKTKVTQAALIDKFAKVLKVKCNIDVSLATYNDKLIPPDIQRVIRALVEKDNLNSSPDYQRLNASRSFCGNSAFSIFIFTVVMSQFSILSMCIGIVVTCSLLYRQVKLDNRVWREIYYALLILDLPEDNTKV